METTAAPAAATCPTNETETRWDGAPIYSLTGFAYHGRCDYTSTRTWHFVAGVAVCRECEHSPWPSCAA
jgi:hypothetical protein